MARIRTVVPALVLGIAIGSWFVPARAQSRNDDVLPALLVEVKGLRAAMEQMVSNGARSQLLVGRLQLQEARLNGMIRRLDEVRDALEEARGDLEDAQAKLKTLEAPDSESQGLAGLTKMFLKPEDVQREIAGRQATIARLQTEEAHLMQQIAADQGRWTEVSQRLDELERALAKR